MRTMLFLLSLTLILFSCSSQEARTFFFPEIGWTIGVPGGFKIIDSTANANLNAKGQKLLEDKNNMQYDASQTKTLFTGIKPPNNYLGSTLTRYDPQKDGDFGSAIHLLQQQTYNALTRADTKIDSSSSAFSLDGLPFTRLSYHISVNGKFLYDMEILLTLYKGYDFTISYLYMDDISKQQIESALAASKFSR